METFVSIEPVSMESKQNQYLFLDSIANIINIKFHKYFYQKKKKKKERKKERKKKVKKKKWCSSLYKNDIEYLHGLLQCR